MFECSAGVAVRGQGRGGSSAGVAVRGQGRGGSSAGVAVRGQGRGGRCTLWGRSEALQYNCQVWLTHCVGEQKSRTDGSGSVDAVLGSAPKLNGTLLKPVYQKLS